MLPTDILLNGITRSDACHHCGRRSIPTGVTGLRILRDIIAGQTDPHALAQHRDHRCQASEAEITAALTGHYRPEHVFVLQQNLELFDAFQRQLAACDVAIEAHVQTLAAQAPAPVGPLPTPRTRKKPRDNEPRFDMRTPLHQLTGVDLTQIDALGPYSALRLLAEIGTDMSRWPTEKHFTSWLTLAPHNKISGGRLLSSRTQPSTNRAAGILRMAAMSLGRTETALGAFYRRLAYRVGKAKAITATARKLAILVYRTLKDGLVYHDPGGRRVRRPASPARHSPLASARGRARLSPRRSRNRRTPRRGSSFLGEGGIKAQMTEPPFSAPRHRPPAAAPPPGTGSRWRGMPTLPLGCRGRRAARAASSGDDAAAQAEEHKGGSLGRRSHGEITQPGGAGEKAPGGDRVTFFGRPSRRHEQTTAEFCEDRCPVQRSLGCRDIVGATERFMEPK
jgi:Transposase IS116/IS110/IS902 family